MKTLEKIEDFNETLDKSELAAIKGGITPINTKRILPDILGGGGEVTGCTDIHIGHTLSSGVIADTKDPRF